MRAGSFENNIQEIMKYVEDKYFEITVAVVTLIITTFVLLLCCCVYMFRQDSYTSSSQETRSRVESRRTLSKNAPIKTGWEISPNLEWSSIGVNFNQWRKPDSKWGPGELNSLAINLRDFDIERKAWDRATTAVDSVLKLLLQEIKKEARNYPGLAIDKIVRQGSSREGLKVSMADEFDALLLFKIEDIDFKVIHLKDGDNWTLPEFGHLVVGNFTQSDIEWRYQKLYKDGVFTFRNGINGVFLNSRNLQEKVFNSIIKKAANRVEARVNTPETFEEFDFTIRKFRINPPAINIEINLLEKKGHFDYANHIRYIPESLNLQSAVETVIDVDIVPGLEIARDIVPDPTDWNSTMECPKYAVFKWFTDNQPSAALYNSPPDIRWRVCSSGYEKHVLDVSRGSKEECYIVTALRLMKREFRNLKMNESPPRQVVTVLRSYHLKHIAFYCILYLVIINKEEHIAIIDNMKLSGVGEALAYFLDFLQVCLEERRLPHFFHANELLVYMFPGYKVEERSLRYDLFTGKSADALRQAELSFGYLKTEIKRKYCKDVYTHKGFSG